MGRKKSDKRRHFVQKDHCLELRHERAMPKSLVERYFASWRCRMYRLSSRWQLRAWTITRFLQVKERLSDVCTQVVLKCMYLARIGRPHLLQSVHISARSGTKLTKACERIFLRLITCINQTLDHRQFCHVGNEIGDCKFDFRRCFFCTRLAKIL